MKKKNKKYFKVKKLDYISKILKHNFNMLEKIKNIKRNNKKYYLSLKPKFCSWVNLYLGRLAVRRSNILRKNLSFFTCSFASVKFVCSYCCFVYKYWPTLVWFAAHAHNAQLSLGALSLGTFAAAKLSSTSLLKVSRIFWLQWNNFFKNVLTYNSASQLCIDMTAYLIANKCQCCATNEYV